MKITFDKNASEFVLDAFNKKVDANGYVVEKNNESMFVLNKRGDKVHIDSFIGFDSNKEILDNTSLADLLFE